jgi:hypothetical protein
VPPVAYNTPFDDNRRAFELVLGPRAEDVGLESPRHFERVEVRGVDLIERRVLRAANVVGVMRPVAGAGEDGRAPEDAPGR